MLKSQTVAEKRQKNLGVHFFAAPYRLLIKANVNSHTHIRDVDETRIWR